MKCAKRKKTKGDVTIPGPSFIHTDSTKETFSDFFHEIRKGLKCKDGQPHILFGSDAEGGIRKGAEMIFTKGYFFYCMKHIKENIKEDLKACEPSIRNEILVKIFGKKGWGEDGITSAIDEEDFLRRKLDIDSTPFPARKFEYHMKKIWENVQNRLESNNIVDPNYTSNPCECVNALVKLMANFQIQKLPELVDLLKNLAKLDKSEFMKAFIGKGGISIPGKLGEKCYVRPDLWKYKSVEQHENVFKTFVTRGRTDLMHTLNTVTSTNGLYTMDNPGGVRQKKNHPKRPTRQRTSTRGVKRKNPVYDEDDDSDFV